MKNYGKVAPYAPAYAMNDEFSRVLHQQMEFFSSNPSADTLNRVRGEVNEVVSGSSFTGSLELSSVGVSPSFFFLPWITQFLLSYGDMRGCMNDQDTYD